MTRDLPASPGAALSKGRVLCVDDEPHILRSLQWLLQKEFDVVLATSGAEGLERLGQHDFDVVISDQRMPGMTGSEFLREVRRLAPRAMRLLLTGYSDLQAILRSVNEGEVFRFINKPWKLDELPRVVAEAAAIARTQPAPAPAPETDESAPPDTGGEKILVVDDDPAMKTLVEQAVGQGTAVAYASNLADAVALFEEGGIGIVLSDMRVAELDATRMLKLLKQEHPDVVTVVYTGVTDAADVVTLINEGQIFRFISKPIKQAILRVALGAAWFKRHQLRQNPAIAKRHAVESVADGVKASLLKDVRRAAQTAGSAAGAGGILLQRITSGFQRMFGAR